MKNGSHRSPGRPPLSASETPRDQLILETATRLFINHGYQKVSVDDISNACGVTKATVYYYFSSKTVLFTEAMIQMMARIRREIISLLKTDKPFKERLYDVTLGHLRATTSFDMEGFMREIKTVLDTDQLNKIKAAEDGLYEAIGETIIAEIESGKVKDLNPMFAAQVFVSIMKIGHYKQKDGSTLFAHPEDAAKQIVDFYWDGLKK
jgi:TetR/AcrR family transcriptional regulator, regulator of autoinduction and epiphytic fitness